jgi:hypothetical protein
MLTTKKSPGAAALTLAAALFTAGCQNYTEQSADFNHAWKTGQIQTAAAEITKKAASHADDKDTVVWALEKGTVLRTAALANIAPPPSTAPTIGAAPGPEPAQAKSYAVIMMEDANAAFESAATKIAKYDDVAKTKVSSEVGSTLTNQTNRPYRGRGLDRVMLHTYLTANYIGLGATDKARVELNRVIQAQRDSVEANAKRIAAAQEEVTKAKDKGDKSYDADKAQQDPKVAANLSGMETELNANIKGYEDYVNPFSVFLDGIFFGANAEGSSDFERARMSLRRVASMNPENPYTKEDLAIANELHLGKSFDQTTYVIFETGSAPTLEEWRLDIPVFAFSDDLSYVGIALPRIKIDPVFIESIVAEADGAAYPTSIVSSMDSVVSQEFKNEWPAVLTRAIVSAGVKAVADAVVQKQAKDKAGVAGEFAAKFGMAALQMAINIADTRSWTTLPKQFQYCRFHTPKNGIVAIHVGGSTQEVKLEPAQVNIIWVRSVSPSAPTYVSQSVLKK